jgi:hypothetical protein
MNDRSANSAMVGDAAVADEVGLRGLYQQPMELAVLKQLDRMPIAATSSRIRRLPSSARRAPAAAPM